MTVSNLMGMRGQPGDTLEDCWAKLDRAAKGEEVEGVMYTLGNKVYNSLKELQTAVKSLRMTAESTALLERIVTEFNVFGVVAPKCTK